MPITEAGRISPYVARGCCFTKTWLPTVVGDLLNERFEQADINVLLKANTMGHLPTYPHIAALTPLSEQAGIKNPLDTDAAEAL